MSKVLPIGAGEEQGNLQVQILGELLGVETGSPECQSPEHSGPFLWISCVALVWAALSGTVGGWFCK